MPEKRKDWTKIEVKTIKENLGFISICFIVILAMIIISWVVIANLLNTQNDNSGITVEPAIQEKNITNITEIKQSNESLLIDSYGKLVFNLLPIILGLFVLFRLLGWNRDD
jgi:hypothetical protein